MNQWIKIINTARYMTKPYTHVGDPSSEEQPPPAGYTPDVSSPNDRYPENSIPTMDMPRVIL